MSRSLAKLCLASVAGVAAADGLTLSLWQSADGTEDRLTQKADLKFESDFEFSGPTVSISNTVGQTIKGFGGAFTESSGKVFQKLTREQQDQLIEDYFGPSGNGYTMGRTHINSCDFSVSSYSFDDVDGDVNLDHFDSSLARDTEVLIPLIQAAQASLKKQGKSLNLLATPWSPPAWMKNLSWNYNLSIPNTMDHSGSPCLKPGMAPVWAKYFDKWIAAYKEHDIPIWAVTVQNEPENNASWEGCLMNPDEEADFLGKHLGPQLRASHPEVEIFIHDHNKDHIYNFTKAVFTDPDASKYATGVAYHWYSGDQFDMLQKVKSDFPQATQLASEATYEQYRWKSGTTLAKGDWSFGEGYAHDIINDLNVGAIGWLDWNLVLDQVGGPNHVDNVCDSAVQVNLSKGEVYKHPQYYYIGHFSRFLLPGSLQLATEVKNSQSYQGELRAYGTCSADDGVEAVAAKRPDGQIAVVVLNCGDNAVDFKLQHGELAAKLSLPAHGIQTYMFKEDNTEIVI